MDLPNPTEQRKQLCNKKKNVKYGVSDKCDLMSLLQTCKSGKKSNKVAFLSGVPCRFDVKKNDTLGPGTYNIGFPKCQAKKNGQFPARPRDLRINSYLSPDIYADGLKRHTIQSRVENKITARGPFDTFTGPRDSSTLVGLTAQKKSYLISDSWPLPLDSYVSNSRYRRTYTNVFKQKTPRQKMEHNGTPFHCVSMPNWKSRKTNKYPFNDSQRVGNSLEMIENSLKPGPGQYNIDGLEQSSKNGHTNVFKSATAQRLQTTPRSHGIFD